MNDLEMIKAFAKLEGVELHKDSTIYKSMFCDARRLVRPSMTNKEIEKRMYGCENSNYNPLLPNALNCAARDKYLVTILYSGNWHQISVKLLDEYIDVDDIESIPKAVIECILKSEGLWK